jgi:hypothetical protein
VSPFTSRSVSVPKISYIKVTIRCFPGECPLEDEDTQEGEICIFRGKKIFRRRRYLERKKVD